MGHLSRDGRTTKETYKHSPFTIVVSNVEYSVILHLITSRRVEPSACSSPTLHNRSVRTGLLHRHDVCVLTSVSPRVFPPQNGLNALHLAAKEGHTDLVEELLERGAPVNSPTKVHIHVALALIDFG